MAASFVGVQYADYVVYSKNSAETIALELGLELTVNTPPGAQVGDTIVLIFWHEFEFGDPENPGPVDVFIPPDGFTELTGQFNTGAGIELAMKFFYKTLTEAPAATYTVTDGSDYGQNCMGLACVVIRGIFEQQVTSFFDTNSPPHTLTPSLAGSHEPFLLYVFIADHTFAGDYHFGGDDPVAPSVPPDFIYAPELTLRLEESLYNGVFAHAYAYHHRKVAIATTTAVDDPGTLSPGSVNYFGPNPSSGSAEGHVFSFGETTQITDEKIWARGAFGYGFARGFA